MGESCIRYITTNIKFTNLTVPIKCSIVYSIIDLQDGRIRMANIFSNFKFTLISRTRPVLYILFMDIPPAIYRIFLYISVSCQPVDRALNQYSVVSPVTWPSCFVARGKHETPVKQGKPVVL